MTPEDIRSQRFTTRLLHGVSSEEVSAFLEDVAEAFGNIQTAHAALIERTKVLEAQLKTLSSHEPQPAPPPALQESPALQEAQVEAESMLTAAREREASATSRIEVLRTAALREVEALLHGAQVRAQSLLDDAQARDAAMQQDAEAVRARVRAEADEVLAGATARADALLVNARQQEDALRAEIERLTQSRVQLVDDIRGNLEAYQEWLSTMDPRGRARGRREAFAPSNGDTDEVPTDEARVS
jgi:DivIVA domain-containing protein